MESGVELFPPCTPHDACVICLRRRVFAMLLSVLATVFTTMPLPLHGLRVRGTASYNSAALVLCHGFSVLAKSRIQSACVGLGCQCVVCCVPQGALGATLCPCPAATRGNADTAAAVIGFRLARHTALPGRPCMAHSSMPCMALSRPPTSEMRMHGPLLMPFSRPLCRRGGGVCMHALATGPLR